MIYLIIKHLIVSSINILTHLPIYIWHFLSMKYYYNNQDEFVNELVSPIMKFLVPFFFKSLIIYSNYEIINSMMIHHEVYFNAIEEEHTSSEIKDLIEKEKQKNSYQNDSSFISKFLVKILLSLFVFYLIENFF